MYWNVFSMVMLKVIFFLGEILELRYFNSHNLYLLKFLGCRQVDNHRFLLFFLKLFLEIYIRTFSTHAIKLKVWMMLKYVESKSSESSNFKLLLQWNEIHKTAIAAMCDMHKYKKVCCKIKTNCGLRNGSSVNGLSYFYKLWIFKTSQRILKWHL